MKWAYLGNFGPHNTESEIAKAVEANGWEVDRYQEGDQGAMAALIANAPAYDVIAWTRTKSLADRTGDGPAWKLLTIAERAGVPTIGIHLDRWIGLEREHEIAESPFFRCSTLFTADGGHPEEWESYGVRHVWMPPAVSEFECVPGTPRDEFRSEIGFIGSWDGYGHAEAWHRPALVQWLRDNYGDRVSFWPKRGEHAVRGDDLRDLIASVKLWVGDSCILSAEEARTRGFYWSDRVPEILGRGGVLAHPDTQGLKDQHFTAIRWGMGEWDGDPIGLRGLIEDWLGRSDDEVREWGELGRDDTLLRNTYTVRVREIAETLGLT